METVCLTFSATETSRYCVKAPLSSSASETSILGGGRSRQQFQTWLLLTEMDGPMLHHLQGQKDVQLIWPLYACTLSLRDPEQR